MCFHRTRARHQSVGTLEPRRLSAVNSFTWDGDVTGPVYMYTEPGVSASPPSHGPHDSGRSTAYTLTGLPEHRAGAARRANP